MTIMDLIPMGNSLHSRGFYSTKQLQSLSLTVMDNIDKLLLDLDVNFQRGYRMFVGPCPIHDGDNATAFNLYHLGDACVGNWKCRSHGCHNYFVNNIIGFTRGVLSHQKHGWSGDGDPIVSLSDTVEYLLKLLDTDISKLKIHQDRKDSRRFIDTVETLTLPSNMPLIKRDTVRNHLIIPAQYYLDRGYSSTILHKYDVGVCTDPTKPMYNRAVVPVYDDNHEFMLGCSGRSLFERCDKCKSWHSPQTTCPEQKNRRFYTKWRHSKNFFTQLNLYNYWNAAKHIKQSGVAVVVESPGNCWRLEEANIFNSVGLFGSVLSPKQRMILDGSGALSLVLIMDNDDNKAGQKAAQIIKDQCQRIYNVKIITPSKNDIGMMSVELIQTEILPQIKEIEL